MRSKLILAAVAFVAWFSPAGAATVTLRMGSSLDASAFAGHNVSLSISFDQIGRGPDPFNGAASFWGQWVEALWTIGGDFSTVHRVTGIFGQSFTPGDPRPPLLGPMGFHLDAGVTSLMVWVSNGELVNVTMVGERFTLTTTDDVQVAATPLPASLSLLSSGLAGLGLLMWRRRRKQASQYF